MTVTVPTSEAQYGYVVGRVIRALGDSADPDDKPDAVAATGKVSFTPKATLGRTTDYSAFIVREKLDAPLDAEGNLVRYEGATPAGISLTVGAYKVEFALASGSIPSFEIEVTAAHTQAAPLDLVTAAPYVPPTGVTVQTMLVPADAVVGQVLAWSASGLDWVDMAAAAGGVSSVAGRTGAVVLSSADLTDAASLATDAELTAGLAGKADALGADDNYVTDAEKVKLANLSGTNTGDQDLSGYATTASLATVATTGAYADLSGTPTIPDSPDDISAAPASGQAAVNALTAGATVTIPATHSMHTLTMTGNTTLTFSNPTAGHAFTLKLSGAFVPTFPASVTWAGGSAPTYASGKVYVFATFDAGASWTGSAL